MPALDWSNKSGAFLNALPAMKSDMVKPMPANQLALNNWRKSTLLGKSASFNFTATQAKSVIPIALPKTSPRNTPTLTILNKLWLNSMVTPAFAKAKRGRIK